MKKYALFVLAAAISGSVSAGTVGPSGTGAQGTVDETACAMVNTNSSFTFKASANVGVGYLCDTTAAAVQAGSTKGKYVYGGGTTGGGVKQCGTTPVSTSTGYSAVPTSAGGDGCS
jgi:hypothetical protein